MTQTLDEFFLSPEFQKNYGSLQLSANETLLAEQRLSGIFHEMYSGDPGISSNDIVFAVEDMLGDPLELVKNIYGQTSGIPTAREAYDQAKKEVAEKTKDVLEVAKKSDIGSFAIYGLKTHLAYSPPSKLKENVSLAVEDIGKLDEFLKINHGSLLTILRSGGVYSGKISDDSLDIDDSDQITLPIGSPVAAMSLISPQKGNEDLVYEDVGNIQIKAGEIHVYLRPGTKPKYYDQWSELLVANKLFSSGLGITFAAGNPENGNPVLDGIREDDIEFYKSVIERIRKIGQIAEKNSLQT